MEDARMGRTNDDDTRPSRIVEAVLGFMFLTICDATTNFPLGAKTPEGCSR
jgi:hypothetical protein